MAAFGGKFVKVFQPVGDGFGGEVGGIGEGFLQVAGHFGGGAGVILIPGDPDQGTVANFWF